MRAIIAWTRKLRHVRIWENTFTLDLLTHDGVCRGALIADPATAGCWSGPSRRSCAPAARASCIANRPIPRWPPPTAMPSPIARGRTARHGVHAVPSHRAVHRRQQPQPDHRGHARRRGLPGRPPRPPLHARLRRARRTGAARRGLAGDRQPDGEDPASLRLSGPQPSGPAVRAGPLPRHRRHLRQVRHRHHPGSHPGAARRALHDRRRDGGPGRPHHAAGPVGGGRGDLQRPARRQPAGVEQPAGSPGLRRPRRPGGVAGGESSRRQLPRPAAGERDRWKSPASRWTWATSATRSRA